MIHQYGRVVLLTLASVLSASFATSVISNEIGPESAKVFICGDHYSEIEVEANLSASTAELFFAGDGWDLSSANAVITNQSELQYDFSITDDQGGSLSIRGSRSQDSSEIYWEGFFKPNAHASEQQLGSCEITT